MLRVAFIGCQGHAGTALASLTRATDAKLVAYVPVPPEETLETFEGWRRQMGDARAYESYEELLDKESPDLVQVSGAYYRNAEIAAVAAERGCHVLVEKPVALDLDTLATVKAAVDRGGGRLSAMLSFRFNPLFAAAKRAAAEGAVGEPLLVTAQKSYRWGQDRPDYFRKRETYGGTIPWVAIHAIDWVHWMLDDPFAAVSARHANLTLDGYPGCEDVAAVSFELKNGGSAFVSADYLRPSAAPTHGDDRIRIAGSNGVLEVLGNQGRTVLIDAEGERDLPVADDDDNVFLSFVSHLVRGTDHPIKPLDPFRVTEVALKARDAADRGERVSLLDSPYAAAST